MHKHKGQDRQARAGTDGLSVRQLCLHTSETTWGAPHRTESASGLLRPPSLLDTKPRTLDPTKQHHSRHSGPTWPIPRQKRGWEPGRALGHPRRTRPPRHPSSGQEAWAHGALRCLPLPEGRSAAPWFRRAPGQQPMWALQWPSTSTKRAWLRPRAAPAPHPAPHQVRTAAAVPFYPRLGWCFSIF